MKRKDLIKKGAFIIGGAPLSQAETFNGIIARANAACDTLAEIKKAKAEREVKEKAEWNKLCNWCW